MCSDLLIYTSSRQRWAIGQDGHHDQEANNGRVWVNFIFLSRFCPWTAWGSLISNGRLISNEKVSPYLPIYFSQCSHVYGFVQKIARLMIGGLLEQRLRFVAPPLQTQ